MVNKSDAQTYTYALAVETSIDGNTGMGKIVAHA